MEDLDEYSSNISRYFYVKITWKHFYNTCGNGGMVMINNNKAGVEMKKKPR